MKHHVRIVYDPRSRGGTWSPCLNLFLKGPNGSVAGYGPKGWPQFLRFLYPRYTGHSAGKWSSTLTIPLYPSHRWMSKRLGFKRSLRVEAVAMRLLPSEIRTVVE